MSLDKFRTRIFVTSNLTISATGTVVLPYNTTAPTLATNGNIAISHVGGTAKLLIRSGGSTFTVALPTAAAGGSITITSA